MVNKNDPKRWLFVLLNPMALVISVFIWQDMATQHAYYKQHYQRVLGDQFEMVFNMLYTVPFFFMIFFNLYAGYLCDKVGGGICLMLGTSFVLVGQLLTLLGIRFEIVWVLFFARFFIQTSITINIMSSGNIISKHFPEDQLGFANGVVITFQDFGMFLNMCFATQITEAVGLLNCSGILFAASIVGFLISIAVFLVDKKLTNDSIQKYGVEFEDETNEVQQKSEQKQQQGWKDFKQSKTCWNFIFSGVALNLVSTLFLILLPAYLSEKFSYSPQKAGQISSLFPLFILSLPFISKMIDIFQHPLRWFIPCGFIGAASIWCIQSGYFVIPCVVLFGLQYNIRWGAIFPILNQVAVKGSESKCFALMRGIRDLISVFVTFANGVLHDYTNSYDMSMSLLAFIQALASVFAIISYMSYEKQNTVGTSDNNNVKINVENTKEIKNIKQEVTTPNN